MENNEIHILLYYKFQRIVDVEYFVRKHKMFCKGLGVKGKVLVAKEGINGSISGSKGQVEKYKEFVWSLDGFSDVVFKEDKGKNHPFTKMIVRVRDEIVSLRKDIKIDKTGDHLSPEEFLELYENGKNRNNDDRNDIIILDVRNDYEFKLGRFKNAVNPNIKTFREFPEFVEKFKEDKENINKKIIMYCTGGIRCEKASAYMIENGFKDVRQLQGGIINFCQQFPNTVWDGKCFVFDKRLMSDLNQGNEPITNCLICDKICDLYRNCKNVDCDELVIMCVECQEKLHGCCSLGCMDGFLKYSRVRAEGKRFVNKLLTN